MTDFSMQLSAYLDGELSAEDTKLVEDRLASDPAAEKELEALMAADHLAKDQFDDLLQDPIPLDLAQKIKTITNSRSDTTTTIVQDNQKVSSQWQSIAASFFLFTLGGVAGFALHQTVRPAPIVVAEASWLTEIADYHAVYAKQKRHLVEVPGSEVNHIEKWLGKTIATNFSVPDMKDQNLNFEGARLLVIKGQPVAQLIYKEENGTVIALCFKKNWGFKKNSEVQKEQTSKPINFKTNKINKFDFVSWKNDEAVFTIVGPDGHTNLKEIAALASTRI